MKTREQIYADLDRKFEIALLAHTKFGLSLTAARIYLGTASWRERLAYRFPHRLGWLSEEARTDRLYGR